MRQECLSYALSIREQHGIWGGLTENERRDLLNRDTVPLDTVPLDTVPLDTVLPDTVPLDTVLPDTVPLSALR